MEEKARREHRDGLNNISRELETRARDLGFRNVSVHHNGNASAPGPTTFTVTADGKSSEYKFNRQDIDDSSQHVDSFATTKVDPILSNLEQPD